MDVPQWSQQVQVANLGTRPMEEIEKTTPPNINNNSREATSTLETRSRTRPQKDQIINCPRCNSTNTKFCYYNNYSLTQPRFFCKTCRRYWTQGGSLRNVPVGGGSRKNKRSSSYSTPPQPPPISSSTTTPPPSHNKLLLPDLNPPTSLSQLFTNSQNPNNIKFLEGQDLNLAFPMQGLLFNHQLSKIEGNNNNKNENFGLPIDINGSISSNNSCITSSAPATATPLSALELLRSGIASRGSLNPFAPISMTDSSTLYQGGYPNMQEFKPSMNIFSSQNHHNNNNIIVGSNNDHHHDHNTNNNARLLFPFGDMNKLATNNTQHHDHELEHHDNDDQSKGSNGNDHLNNHQGYWSGMLGGGPW